MNNLTIGLFGTCDKSHWRDKFIVTYKSQDVPYYNPQVKDWNLQCAQIEAEHLANDRDKLHNCKGCLWSGVCAFENTGLIKCKEYYSVYGNSYDDQRANEYNTALQERSDDYMDLVREMCDELYDS